MPIHPANKYHLKDLHAEISYLDRKIAYAEAHEKFTSDAAREDALKKLRLKRAPLVKAALDLAERGVEWDAKDLPRSLTPTEAPATVKTASVEDAQ
jgi:heme oxygenase